MILSVIPKNDLQSGRPIGLPRRLYCVETKLERKLWSGFYTSNGKCKLAKFTSSHLTHFSLVSHKQENFEVAKLQASRLG
jgi:hypothetical protein